MSSEEYHQLSHRCWSKFYNYCSEYQELVSRPQGLFRDPRTGVGVVLREGAVSFLRPAELYDTGERLELVLLQDEGNLICV